MSDSYGAATPTQDKAAVDPGYTVELWKAELARARKCMKKWEDDCDKIIKKYRADASMALEDTPRFSVLWANTQTMMPAVYARQPQPVVQRRFLDRDPVARTATQILERALKYEIDSGQLHAAMKLAIEDYALCARGQAWVRYDASFVTEQITGADGAPVLAQGQPLTIEKVDRERICIDYIYRKDFLHAPARIWKEVAWVAKRAYLSRPKLVELCGPEIGNAVPLNCGPEGEDSKAGKNAYGQTVYEELRRAEVWEIWCKDTMRVHWICPDHDVPLKEMDDPLQLEDFFPCPEPVYGTLTTDSLIPVPDYKQYEGQAVEMDDLCARTDKLIAACKVVGTYDASSTALARMLTEGVENELIANENWAAFAQQGGLKGSMDFLPLEQFVGALMQIYQARASTKSDIYEITGMSDIIRGQSDPTETATAQQIKGQYASLRLRSRQQDVARFVRDLIRIMGEIICEHFRPQTLWEMSGAQEMVGAEDPRFMGVFMQACQLLQNERLRGFKVDIETDSTVAADEQEEKSSRAEFLRSVGGLLGQALPAVEKYPGIAPLIGHMVLFAVRGFRVGRELESVFEQAVDQLERTPLPQPPDENAQAQAKVQGEMARDQQSHEMDMTKKAVDIQADRERNDAELQKINVQARTDLTQELLRTMRPQPQPMQPPPGGLPQ